VLGKAGHRMESVIYEMSAGLVNQLMACHWMEMGVELETPEIKNNNIKEIAEKLEQFKKRKVKFDL
jgi:hypothetical protein